MSNSTLGRVIEKNMRKKTDAAKQLIEKICNLRVNYVKNKKLRSAMTIKNSQKLVKSKINFKEDSYESLNQIKLKYKEMICKNSSFLKKIAFEVSLSPFGLLIYNISLFSCVIPICMFYHPMTVRGIKLVTLFNLITLTFSLVLLLMRFPFVSCREMKKDYFLFFDVLIIVLSFLEILASYIYNNYEYAVPSSLASLFIIRNFLRFKTLRSSSSLRDYYRTYIKMFESMKQLLIFILTLILIYALIGMRIFGEIEYDKTNEIFRRNNFKNFPRAFLSAFTIISSETWAEIFYEFKHKIDRTYTTAYFFSLYFFVSFIMLNFLLSIILNSISEASKRIDSKSKMKKVRKKKPSIDALILSKNIS